MTIQIQSKEEQPLLGRTTITAKVGFEGATPTRAQLRKDVAKAAKVDADKTIIKRVTTHFGGHSATIEAAVYEKREDAEAVEHKSLMGKHAEEKKENDADKTEGDKKEEEPANDEKAQEDEQKEA